MAHVTHPHVWSYQAWNQRKTLGREKNLLSSWALDKSVRMVYYHLSSVIFVRVWRCSLLYIWIMRACLLCPYFKYCFVIDVCTNSMFTLDIWVVDGKFIVFVCRHYFYSLEYIHFLLWTQIVHSYDFEDSPWYLVVAVADGTIVYDAYSTPTMWSRFNALHVPGSVSVACLQYLPVSCERDGLWARDLDTCKNSSGEAVSIGTPCWQICTVNLC